MTVSRAELEAAETPTGSVLLHSQDTTAPSSTNPADGTAIADGSLSKKQVMLAEPEPDPFDDDATVQRTRLLAAIAAGNALVLRETLDSLPARAVAEDIALECSAGKKVLSLMDTLSERDAALERSKATVKQLKAREAELVASGRRAVSDSTAATERISELESIVNLHGEDASRAQSLTTIQQGTRINELQAIIVSLQTQLRQSEQQVAKLSAKLSSAEASAAPTLAENAQLRAEVTHLRTLRTRSDEAATVLQAHLDETRKQLAHVGGQASSSVPNHGLAPQPGSLGSQASSLLAEEQALTSSDANATATVASLRSAVHSEAVRRQHAESSRAAMELEVSRIKRAAESSMGDLQGEVARLQHELAQLRQSSVTAVAEAQRQSEADVKFRQRAEKGWAASQASAQRLEEAMLEARQKSAEIEGRLGLAQSQLAEAHGEISSLQKKLRAEVAAREAAQAGAEAAEAEWERAAKKAEEDIAVVRQLATAAAAAATAEHDVTVQTLQADATRWRARAERHSARTAAARNGISAVRSSMETMLTRMAMAQTLSDLSELSRLLFDAKAKLTQIDEVIQQRDQFDETDHSTSADGHHLSYAEAASPHRRSTIQQHSYSAPSVGPRSLSPQQRAKSNNSYMAAAGPVSPSPQKYKTKSADTLPHISKRGFHVSALGDGDLRPDSPDLSPAPPVRNGYATQRYLNVADSKPQQTSRPPSQPAIVSDPAARAQKPSYAKQALQRASDGSYDGVKGQADSKAKAVAKVGAKAGAKARGREDSDAHRASRLPQPKNSTRLPKPVPATSRDPPVMPYNPRIHG